MWESWVGRRELQQALTAIQGCRLLLFYDRGIRRMTWLKRLLGGIGKPKAGRKLQSTDDWSFYSLLVDDEPASIFLDLGIARNAPIAAYDYRACLRLVMRDPREDGLSSAAEFDTLVSLEDSVTSQIVADCPSIYVGRNTSGGHRDLYFYVSDARLFEQAAKAAMVEFPLYEFELQIKHDPEWDAYFNFLYPTPAQQQQISDTALIQLLGKNGDRSDQPRQIDHFALFSDEEKRTAFEAVIAARGYTIDESRPKGSDGKFGVEFWHVGTPVDMYDRSQELHELAAEYEGEYDGWACAVVT